jgi:hypothetical protein
MGKPLLYPAMGGFGSGRYPRLSRAKQTADRCRDLDVNDFNRNGVLRPGYRGTIQWTRDDDEVASIGVQCVLMVGGRDALRLSYTVTPLNGEEREVDYRVPLTYTKCNFGGERPWFECPGHGCGERVGKLYKPPRGGDYYLCRHCHDLGYKSSQKSGTPSYEHLLKPLERANAAAEALTERPFDREVLRDYYEAQKGVIAGARREFDGYDPPRRREPTMNTFDEWADALFNDAFADFGFYGQCEATAKTTDERCRQSALGEHGKCYYHGGAPGSGIGEGQRDHEAERLEEMFAELEAKREREREQIEELLSADG